MKRRKPISEILQRKGYTTGAFHSNPYLSQIFGYDRGFDVFSDELAQNGGPSHTSFSYALGRRLLRILHSNTLFAPVIRSLNRAIGLLKGFEWLSHQLLGQGRGGHLAYARAAQINEKAKQFIQNHQEPFFLWVHYMDSHTPFLPPQSYIEETSRKISRSEAIRLYRKQVSGNANFTKEEIKKLKFLYTMEIKYMDNEIGKFLRFLKTEGLSKRSIVAITSDHGEEFQEHGDLLHKEKLYNELLHVPLFIQDPELLGKKISRPVSLIDLTPTLLDLLGFSRPKEMHGRSLLALIQEGNGDYSEVISDVASSGFMELPSSTVKITIQNEGWKLIHNKNKRDELYRIKTDPKEKINLIGREKRITEELLNKIQKHLASRRKSRVKVTKQTIRKKIFNLKKSKRLQLDQ